MPFGLVSACCTCQRLSDWICDGCENFARAYLDDLVIFSDEWNDHLKQVEIVLRRVQDAEVTLKPSKCVFASGQVSYLGYVVGSGTIRPEQMKVSSIQEFSRPVIKTEVKSFLGTIGFYRRFVPNFSELSFPLTDMLSGGKPMNVVWSEQAQRSFEVLKKPLCVEPILKSPAVSKPFFVQCDASMRAIG